MDDGSSNVVKMENVHAEQDKMNPAATATRKRFAVAFSFPGEHRRYVEQIADALAAKLSKSRVFCDGYHEAELARLNLDTHLQKIYHDDSELIVVVLCKEYDEKKWCRLESRAIRALIETGRSGHIMPVRIAEGDVKGVFGIDGCVEVKDRPASEIAGLILERLSQITGQSIVSLPSYFPQLEKPLQDGEPASETVPDAAKKKRQDGVNQLKAAVIEILQSEKTLEFILKRNKISTQTSAFELAKKMFAVVPTYHDNAEKYCTPMCFLKNCDPQDTRFAKPPSDATTAIYANLWKLAALLAPVSFVLEDDDAINKMVTSATRSAKVDKSNPTVSGAIVAGLLGRQLDLDHRETVISNGIYCFDGSEMQGFERLYTSGVPPLTNIADDGLVDAVTRSLAPQLGLPAEASPLDVKTELRELEGRGSYVCLCFNRVLHPDSVQRLNNAFPNLYVIMSHSKLESDINSLVFRQIARLRKTVGAEV